MTLFTERIYLEFENMIPKTMDQYEKCVLCGKVTTTLSDTSVRDRSCYIETAGQLCFSCYREIYMKPDEKARNPFRRDNLRGFLHRSHRLEDPNRK